MSFSSTFLECFRKAKIEVNERLHGEINRSVDQLFDMVLREVLDTYGDRFSWSEIVPAVMSPSFLVAANKDSSIWVKKDAEEANTAKSAKLNAARESSDSGDDDQRMITNEYVNPVRVIAVNCIAPGCELSFPTREHVTYHLKEVHRIFEHRCLASPSCKYSSDNVSKLLKHQKKNHGLLKIWHCFRCSQRFDFSGDLMNHLELWHVSGKYACGKKGCSYEAQYRQPVKDHFREIHLNRGGPKKVLCGEGNGATERPVTLMRPRSVPPEATPPKPTQSVESPCKYSTKRLNCFIKNCYTFFSGVDEFHRHLKDNHKIKPFMCLVGGCKDRFYDSIEELEMHVRRLHRDVATWVCHICHRTFVDHPTLRKHIQCFHEEGLFACVAPGCTMTAKYRADVVVHYEEQHRTASQNVAST